MNRLSRVRSAVLPLAAAGVALATVFFLAQLGGHPAGAAAQALWAGAFGSVSTVLSYTLVRATPLILLGLAVALAFRAGILNIGGEGQFLVGAVAGFAAALAVPSWPSPFAQGAVLAAGALAGGAWAGIAAWLKHRFGTFEVISTLMLNFVAAFGVSYLVRGPLQEPSRVYPASTALAEAARLPRLIPGYLLHLGFLVAVLLGVALWWGLRSTAAGFRIRAVGAGPAAAASAGRIRVAGVIASTFLASGAIAGLAGAVQVSGVTFALYEDLSPGYGYSAIAVALLARLHPLGVVASAVFFGALDAGADAMQRNAGVPAQFVAIIEGLVVLVVLALDRAGTLAARANAGAT